ncbi:hypothetical protein K439DRAFT_949428 [Ramaria rubella]|nr:hypothetical protein K439DRAFT_949428 [Ramaria rubella]
MIFPFSPLLLPEQSSLQVQVQLQPLTSTLHVPVVQVPHTLHYTYQYTRTSTINHTAFLVLMALTSFFCNAPFIDTETEMKVREMA